ncbi:hypothetical protein [Nocardia sp. NPDC006630]|uniref:hypothetical protein n=1 Tax=Nocardia sp. NPDC006630 TaxID=3157181 RepID=UPI0033BD7B3C
MPHMSNGFAVESGRAIVATCVGVLLLVAATGCGTWDGGTIRTAGPITAHTPGAAPKPGSLEGFSSPESVLFAGDRWFISNIGADREPAQDGDGYLTELNSGGTVTARHAMPRPGDPPLNAPKGLAYTGNRVFVTDIDRVVGFDTDTHGQVFEARLGDNAPALLDDLALQDPHSLHGPGDFAVDPAGRNLWIPALRDNRVVIVPLP